MRLGGVSFWYEDIGGLPPRRAGLDGDIQVDVCIVGAGFTGLWTAYYLQNVVPDLTIALVEKEFAGYGASGRNGGWLTGGFAWDHGRYGTQVGALVSALRNSVDEIIAVAEAEGIDADIHRTDELTVAVNAPQMARLKEEIALRQKTGEPVYSLSAVEAANRVAVPNILGAMVTPGVARIQPAKLVQGLASVVETRGARIFEDTEVTDIRSGEVATKGGTVRAKKIIRATEGYTATLHKSKREWLPLNSAQIITDPVPQSIWDKIGWHGKELVGDFAHVYCYCQRTRDGRIAVGSRGVPYLYGSRTDTDGAPDQVTVARLKTILERYFPAAAEVPIAQAWCGVLGVPRDWCATVGFDQDTGVGWAGGYVGVGVSTSNLAGRTLADLVTEKDTDLTRLPWVGRKVQRWEPEPLRWLGVRGMYALLALADRRETHGTKPYRLAKIGYKIAGR